MSKSQDQYAFILNGSLYGVGDTAYMTELFDDYVNSRGLYGAVSVDVKIVEINAYYQEQKKERGL